MNFVSKPETEKKKIKYVSKGKKYLNSGVNIFFAG